MSLLLFLRGLIGVLLIFGITTYYMTGSFWVTLVQTIVVAVLLQVGYFIAVLFMVWRSGRGTKHKSSERDASPDTDGESGTDAAELPAAQRSRNH